MKYFNKIAFLCILALSILISSCSQSITPGTYTGTEKGLGGDVIATVTVDDKGVITDLKISALNETPEIGGDAAKKLEKDILKMQSINIDGVSGASITSAAVFKAVASALTEAGIDPDKMNSNTETSGLDEEISTDVVVIGAGTSGTGATLAAALAGVDVVVLEKLGRVGGLGTTGMGLLATESSLQKAAGQRVTTEAIFDHLITYNHYRSNGPLMKAILDKSGDTIDWLMDNGIGLLLGLGIDQKAHLDYPKTYHMWTNSREDFPNLYERLSNDYGLDLRLNTKGYELIKSDSGKVTGVKAVKEDGGILTVNADAVIVCTGGFGGDPEKLKAASEMNDYNYFGLGNTGDGVEMAWAMGADKLGEHVLQIHLVDIANSKAITNNYMGNPVFWVKDTPLFWVNKEGTRFVDESILYDNVLWGNAAFSAGGGYYAIVDQASVDSFMKNGIPFTSAYQMNGSGLMNPAGGNDVNITIDPLPSLQEELDKFIAEGEVVFKGETLEALSELTGMNPVKLKKNVDAYNNAVKTGIDDKFYKDAEFLRFPVSEGPFYAIKVSGSVYGSNGGVRINEDIQAVRADGTPIEGLYVAGADAGGMYDNTYPDLEGLTMSFAMNSGRIAGENAAAYLEKMK